MTRTGAQLRIARNAAGVSLRAMAARTNFSKGHLSNVEAGRRSVTPDVVLAYERALGDAVDRRGLLTGMAATVVASTAVADLIRAGFTAALHGGGPVDSWLARVDEYGQLYMTVGADQLQRRLAADLVVLQQHLDSAPLWGVAARLLTTFGKTTGDSDEAVSWYRLATTAADRSEDNQVRVWVRGRAALALAYEGARLATAVELADQALAIDDTPSPGRLTALVARAQAAAVHGDRTGALRLLDDARRMFDVAGSSEQTSDFAIPEWRFHTFASMLLSRLGDPAAAAEQDAADRTRPPELLRFATHIELHRGLMLAKAGDVTGGTAYARAALGRLPAEKRSQSLKLMLAEVECGRQPAVS
ncbi:helix-turn-helix transcriptional regulator [Planosporangium thailandense]|uniref:Helix-turn-helix transcriptional regulator n=1 Tax=Planosporangium thailandense TaxID=765197 RepID=A0ABX0Y2R6_9ACTN|nr:helix-turn-helix transcriptional regulator [Planosporangium thailandense]NJC72412.1 helix-turn-helix transcriptional regulator [Planosporangium thailandense]